MKILVALLPFVFACQKKPALSPAADPSSILSLPPMGAKVYNDELKKELDTLDALLNNQLPKKEVSEAKEQLLLQKSSDKAQLSDGLSSLFLTLPELIHDHEHLSENRRTWIKAKLLFLRRRFVEASMLMSNVIKNEPHFIEAINWQARAIFFLGNPDLAIKKLEHITENTPKNSSSHLEALYLIGAIIYESEEEDKNSIKKGIHVWQEYLTYSKTDPTLEKEITNSLKELTSRLNNEEKQHAPFDPFMPIPSHSDEKRAILEAFHKEEMLTALKLCEESLKKSYDKDLAIIKARIFIKTGRMDEASTLFLNIVEKNQSYAPAFHYNGMALMFKGQLKEAITSWQKTFDLDPKYARFHKLDERIAVAKKMLNPIEVESH